MTEDLFDQTVDAATSMVLAALADINRLPYVRLWNHDFTESSPVPGNWRIETDTKEN